MAQIGQRTTWQRLAVAEYLRQAGGFVSAQDLHGQLRESGQKIGLATVYRTLATLADEEMVDVLRSREGELRYRFCSTQDHHHHLVCRVCGHAEEVDDPTVERWADDTAAAHGFTQITHTLEIFGKCADCTTK